MIIKPIPINVLIHTVTYEEFVKGDNFETDDHFELPIILKNVRMQANNGSQTIYISSTGEMMQYQYTLIYDVVNSQPDRKFEFKEKDRVIFEGKKMIVQRVNPVYAFKLHHWELFLT